MYITYDTVADAAYVELTDFPDERPDHTRARRLDEQRYIHVDDEGKPVAVELLFVSRGIDFSDIPEAERIREALRPLAQLAAVQARS